ncbi:flagellar export chaperone FliS [uncultured Desulfuromonas sp.]|uniref:flagellar export chaperone FliS n=1 Tax=uncultured Desulfuromonas sp. TaxID=181013 RepID=UPI002AAB980B|nr:flagellar export chaperone FliS [uncultured Desulfuromonas sp.]
MNTYTQQYQQNQILTASPEQILIMLYDGAIRFTRQAMAGIEAGNKQQRREGISRAMAIISEFANTLDHGVGGEIAENLDGLYAFMNRQLSEANLDEDIEKLKVVEHLLTDLRQTWSEAISIARKEAAGGAAAASQPQNSDVPENYKPLSAAG